LVEDNDINQLVAEGLLDNIGLTCEVAVNGQECLSILNDSEHDHPFTVILMDCQMPVMDGYQATENIREGKAGERYQNIPIIAMTANAMMGDRDKCISSGMNDYMSKPIETELLLKMLKHWLIVNP
jgi:CheY-like chemotaxis protein